MEESDSKITAVVGTDNVVLSENIFPSALRTSFVIVNTGAAAQVISIAFGEEAVSLSGIVLYPQGTYGESIDARFTPTQKRINVISSAAAGSVAFSERIKQGGL
jgi:hypothetical protein